MIPHVASPPEETKISITIQTHAYHISGIRDFTMNLVKNMTGFSEKWAWRFQAVIDELCNNAIEHGSRKGEEIMIHFLVSQDQLTLTVEDTGSSPTAKNANQMKELIKQKLNEQAKNTLGSFSIRGRGLPQIVYSWSDSLDFFDRPQGGLKVQITKNIKNDGAGTV